MYWEVTCEGASGEGSGTRGDAPGLEAGGGQSDGRFVLHRHCDADGPHLDLRLECGECLMGWRIDGTSLDGGPWATEKAPHSVRWLDQGGDAVREDCGTFAWLERGSERKVVVLRGQAGMRTVGLEAVRGLAPGVERSVCAALDGSGVAVEEAGALIGDGVTARRRAVERFCGLGRELDGASFDETVWRKTLERLTLDEISTQLRAYEVRFDAKYPPMPVSRPERLPEETAAAGGEADREGAALAIVREPA